MGKPSINGQFSIAMLVYISLPEGRTSYLIPVEVPKTIWNPLDVEDLKPLTTSPLDILADLHIKDCHYQKGISPAIFPKGFTRGSQTGHVFCEISRVLFRLPKGTLHQTWQWKIHHLVRCFFQLQPPSIVRGFPSQPRLTTSGLARYDIPWYVPCFPMISPYQVQSHHFYHQ